MNFYEIIAPHRSGHHSMMNWLIRNLSGNQCTWEYKMNIISDGMYQLNCANHNIDDSLKFYKEFKNDYKELIVSYEDTFWDYTIFNNERVFKGKNSLNFLENPLFNYQRIVFIRDFYNNLSSRIKANENENFKSFRTGAVIQFDVAENFIDRWKNNAKACLDNKSHFLKFEDWLNNKSKREEFLYRVINNKEIYDNTGIIGTHSSFGETKNLTDRISQINLPKNIKELISKDNELHYLIGKMGYEYREL